MANDLYNGAHYGDLASNQDPPNDKKSDVPSLVEVQEANEAVNDFRELLGRLGVTPSLVKFITHVVELQETRVRGDLCAIVSAVVSEFHKYYASKTAAEISKLQPSNITTAIMTSRPDHLFIEYMPPALQLGYSLGYEDCVSRLEEILGGR